MDTPLLLDSSSGPLKLLRWSSGGRGLAFASREDAEGFVADLAALPGNSTVLRRALGLVRPPWDVLAMPDAEVVRQLGWALDEGELLLTGG